MKETNKKYTIHILSFHIYMYSTFHAAFQNLFKSKDRHWMYLFRFKSPGHDYKP